MHVRVFSPGIFFLSFCKFSIFVFIAVFLYILCYFTQIRTNTVCVRTQAYILRSFLATSQRNCQLVEQDRTMGGKVVKKNTENKDLTGIKTNQRLDGGILMNCMRNVFEKAQYMRNNSTRKIGKKLQFHTIKVSSTTVEGDTMNHKA